MSNLNVKKAWQKWHPEKIYLNDPKKKYNVFWNTSFLKEQDFYTIKKDGLINKIEQLDAIKKKSLDNEELYLCNIKKNLKEQKKKYILLNNKFQDLCLNLESTITLFKKTLFSRLLKTILIISSYIVGEKISISESFLLKKINKIIKNDNFFLKKPKLVVHPNNKKILENNFTESINNKFELVFDENIDLNSFKILTENSDIDSTICARWKEVYRVILEEEEHE